MVEKRLGNLEKSVAEIKVYQKGLNQSVAGINKALAVLVDNKGETLHLIKSQEEAREERDDLFTRIRKLEAGREGCKADQRHAKETVTKLDEDVDVLKTWKTTHASQTAAAEKAGREAGKNSGKNWGIFFGLISVVISAVGLFLRVIGVL